MNSNRFSNLPPVVVIGSGGHARVVIDCLKQAGREILFCTEVDSELYGKTIDGTLIKGPDELILDLDLSKVHLANGMGSIGEPTRRQGIYERFSNQGYCFTSVVHPSATVAKSVKISDGVQIMACAVAQPGVVIGSNSIVNTAASIDHDCQIGAHCHIAPRVVISGQVVVGNRSHVGTGASIIQAIHIGENCVDGAGATVVKNLPDGTVAVGTPAKPINNKKS